MEERPDAVLLSRADYELLLDALDDAQDLKAIAARCAREAEIGVEAARADYLPIEAFDRMMAGESPVRVWREHRGLTLRALAERGAVAPAYLSEIETRRKPGSAAALSRLARALGLDVDDLLLRPAED